MIQCCPRVGFEPGRSNVENFKDESQHTNIWDTTASC